jgi:hypothetical protein
MSNNDSPSNKIYYPIVDKVQEKNLCFHCFNTAWMSQVDEKPGTLFFPVKHFDIRESINNYDLNIAVIHHPLNWFNPDAIQNNKKEFQDLLENISSLLIIGHEHENELRKTENLDSVGSQTLCCCGDIFQNHKDLHKSGFQTFLIDLNTNELMLQRYHWQENIYQQYSEKKLNLNNKSKRIIEANRVFLDELNKFDIPLMLNDKQVKLSEIYIYPDLEILTPKAEDIIEDYIDSETLLYSNKKKHCIFEGESQIGKSSLLHMFFLKYYEKGYYPILLQGKDIDSEEIDKIIRKAFKTQYSEIPINYEKFKQFKKDLKVLLIDDLHNSKLNKYTKQSAINKFIDLFSYSYITIDAAYSILPESKTKFEDISLFSIKPLGFKKSNDLVGKYLTLKEPSLVHDPSYLDNVKHYFRQLREILGDKLIPSYPVFILSIIQALQFRPLNLNETSYGYCYQTLIHYALNNVGITKDDIDTYINILTELAFYMFNMKTESISDIDFKNYYREYEKKYIAPEFELVSSKLLNSRVIKTDSGSICFGYKYILYFLTAKKIAEMIEKPEGQSIVKDLYANLHKEKNANILVFITHHTKNTSFIEESILSVMLPFAQTPPITLERDCNYYRLVENIIKEIKQDVIEMNRDPSEERKKQLLDQDKQERQQKTKDDEENDADIDEKILPFLQAFRSIEIVGQIIKNRKGSLDKETLKEMLIELYKTGFSMISHLGNMFNEIKDELALKIDEKVSQKDSIQDIGKKVHRFLQFISLQTCLGIFSKLIYSVGMKELREIYSDVSKEIDTPAAYIVSFSINSFYGKLNLKELEHLSKEFKNNVVALQILRARVKAYIYNNYVDYKDKQKIAGYLNMNISPTLGREKKSY